MSVPGCSLQRVGSGVILMIILTACAGATSPPTISQPTSPPTISQSAQNSSTDRPAPTATLEAMNFPSNDQILKEVAEGVNVVELPPQPRTKDPVRDGCRATIQDTTSKMCVYGEQDSSRSVVVYGDSHANMWIPAFDAIGKTAHWKIIQMGKRGCQVADFPRWSPEEKRLYTECAAFRSFALEQISELHPDVVVLVSNSKDIQMEMNGRPTRDGLEDAWAKGLEKMIVKIKPMTGKVIVLGSVALPKQAGNDCLSAHVNDVRPCNTSRAEAVDYEHNRMEETVATQSGAQYIDMIPWMCTDTVCPAVVGDLAVHMDLYHIWQNYALWLSGALGDATGLSSDISSQ